MIRRSADATSHVKDMKNDLQQNKMPGALVRRYAEAYLALVKETIGLEPALEELRNFKIILRGLPDLKKFLETPVIFNAEKLRLIDQICQKGFSPQLKNFLELLLEKRRIDLLGDIVDHLLLRYSHKEEMRALIKVSSILDLETIKSIKGKLEKQTAQRLKLYIGLDGDLLGGVIAVMGNTLIDGSLRGLLVQLKEKLMQLKMN